MDKDALVYIASPYSLGDKEENVRNSLLVADELLSKGIIPFAPLLSHFWEQISPKPYEDWLKMDFQYIMRCDAVLRLPGKSSGADMECEFATLHGIPVYYDIDEVINAYA